MYKATIVIPNINGKGWLTDVGKLRSDRGVEAIATSLEHDTADDGRIDALYQVHRGVQVLLGLGNDLLAKVVVQRDGSRHRDGDGLVLAVENLLVRASDVTDEVEVVLGAHGSEGLEDLGRELEGVVPLD